MKRKTTKEILSDSFRELAERKPISKITVTNITDNCGMTQPTFYNHFHDKYDLIAWIYATDLQSIMKRIGENGYQWRDALFDVIKYFAENRAYLLNLFTHTSGREAFLHHMMAANVELLCAEVRKKLMTEKIPEDIYVMIKIYCYGTVQFTCEWLASNMPISPEKTAALMEESLPKPLKPYLYP